MNPLLLLIPIGVGIYFWRRNKSKQTLKSQGPLQVLHTDYDENTHLWTIKANLIQDNGAIKSITLNIPGLPTLQPTIDEILTHLGVNHA